ncbi:putative membrane protein [Nocardia tenerifensis]|uniref:Putative membrane protein n=1 Tax=Nocardia tenerifensis TaxID=228006 RepID=A0A318K536_9NOCA|nr:alpha/beta-hydrolase family protein [Nocardia tenerifensis]PXX64210.1 putative membrane protein [Nocardia tenerifensis]
MTSTLSRPADAPADGAAFGFEDSRERTPLRRADSHWRQRVTAAAQRFSRPRVGTTLAIGAGTLASLAPGLLPRTPGAQAILTGLLVALALGIAGIVRFTLRRCGFDTDRRLSRLRRPALVATSALVVGAVAHAWHWQNMVRAAMNTAAVGADYWPRWLIESALIVGVFAGIARATGWALRTLGWARGVSLAAVATAFLYLVAAPALVGWRQASYASANAELDPALVQPFSDTSSGGAGSEVSWASLGAEGRKFVSGPGPARVYVGVESAPDLDSRVALAVRELERSGAFQRSNLVVMVPTGSGWIDGNAVRGLDQRFGGDVALVGLQYSYAPSWVTFVFGRDEAVAAARALFTAVEHRIRALEHKPALYVYGQSLGALGGSSVFADDADQNRRTCAALWAGPPAGQVHRAGATVLSNSSDPVVHWSPALLWRAPDLTGARTDAPRPQWLPVVSFVQTTADLLAALDAPAGHGHRYGVDQGTAMGTC